MYGFFFIFYSFLLWLGTYSFYVFCKKVRMSLHYIFYFFVFVFMCLLGDFFFDIFAFFSVFKRAVPSIAFGFHDKLLFETSTYVFSAHFVFSTILTFILFSFFGFFLLFIKCFCKIFTNNLPWKTLNSFVFIMYSQDIGGFWYYLKCLWKFVPQWVNENILHLNYFDNYYSFVYHGTRSTSTKHFLQIFVHFDIPYKLLNYFVSLAFVPFMPFIILSALVIFFDVRWVERGLLNSKSYFSDWETRKPSDEEEEEDEHDDTTLGFITTDSEFYDAEDYEDFQNLTRADYVISNCFLDFNSELLDINEGHVLEPSNLIRGKFRKPSHFLGNVSFLDDWQAVVVSGLKQKENKGLWFFYLVSFLFPKVYFFFKRLRHLVKDRARVRMLQELEEDMSSVSYTREDFIYQDEVTLYPDLDYDPNQNVISMPFVLDKIHQSKYNVKIKPYGNEGVFTFDTFETPYTRDKRLEDEGPRLEGVLMETPSYARRAKIRPILEEVDSDIDEDTGPELFFTKEAVWQVFEIEIEAERRLRWIDMDQLNSAIKSFKLKNWKSQSWHEKKKWLGFSYIRGLNHTPFIPQVQIPKKYSYSHLVQRYWHYTKSRSLEDPLFLNKTADYEIPMPRVFAYYVHSVLAFLVFFALLYAYSHFHYWNLMPPYQDLPIHIENVWSVSPEIKEISKMRLTKYKQEHIKYIDILMLEAQNHVFGQAYLDVLQLKYGPTAGNFFFHTPNMYTGSSPAYGQTKNLFYPSDFIFRPLFTTQLKHAQYNHDSVVLNLQSRATMRNDFFWHYNDFLFSERRPYTAHYNEHYARNKYHSYRPFRTRILKKYKPTSDSFWKTFWRMTYLEYRKHIPYIEYPHLRFMKWLRKQRALWDNNIANLSGVHSKLRSVRVLAHKQNRVEKDWQRFGFENLFPKESQFWLYTNLIDDVQTQYYDSIRYYGPYYSHHIFEQYSYAYRAFSFSTLDFLESLLFDKKRLTYQTIIQLYLRPRLDTWNNFFFDLSEDFSPVYYTASDTPGWVLHKHDTAGPWDIWEEDIAEDIPYNDFETKTMEYDDEDDRDMQMESPETLNFYQKFTHDILDNYYNPKGVLDRYSLGLSQEEIQKILDSKDVEPLFSNNFNSLAKNYFFDSDSYDFSLEHDFEPVKFDSAHVFKKPFGNHMHLYQKSLDSSRGNIEVLRDKRTKKRSFFANPLKYFFKVDPETWSLKRRQSLSTFPRMKKKIKKIELLENRWDFQTGLSEDALALTNEKDPFSEKKMIPIRRVPLHYVKSLFKNYKLFCDLGFFSYQDTKNRYGFSFFLSDAYADSILEKIKKRKRKPFLVFTKRMLLNVIGTPTHLGKSLWSPLFETLETHFEFYLRSNYVPTNVRKDFEPEPTFFNSKFFQSFLKKHPFFQYFFKEEYYDKYFFLKHPFFINHLLPSANIFYVKFYSFKSSLFEFYEKLFFSLKLKNFHYSFISYKNFSNTKRILEENSFKFNSNIISSNPYYLRPNYLPINVPLDFGPESDVFNSKFLRSLLTKFPFFQYPFLNEHLLPIFNIFSAKSSLFEFCEKLFFSLKLKNFHYSFISYKNFSNTKQILENSFKFNSNIISSNPYYLRPNYLFKRVRKDFGTEPTFFNSKFFQSFLKKHPFFQYFFKEQHPDRYFFLKRPFLKYPFLRDHFMPVSNAFSFRFSFFEFYEKLFFSLELKTFHVSFIPYKNLSNTKQLLEKNSFKFNSNILYFNPYFYNKIHRKSAFHFDYVLNSDKIVKLNFCFKLYFNLVSNQFVNLKNGFTPYNFDFGRDAFSYDWDFYEFKKVLRGWRKKRKYLKNHTEDRFFLSTYNDYSPSIQKQYFTMKNRLRYFCSPWLPQQTFDFKTDASFQKIRTNPNQTFQYWFLPSNIRSWAFDNFIPSFESGPTSQAVTYDPPIKDPFEDVEDVFIPFDFYSKIWDSSFKTGTDFSTYTTGDWFPLFYKIVVPLDRKYANNSLLSEIADDAIYDFEPEECFNSEEGIFPVIALPNYFLFPKSAEYSEISIPDDMDPDLFAPNYSFSEDDYALDFNSVLIFNTFHKIINTLLKPCNPKWNYMLWHAKENIPQSYKHSFSPITEYPIIPTTEIVPSATATKRQIFRRYRKLEEIYNMDWRVPQNISWHPLSWKQKAYTNYRRTGLLWDVPPRVQVGALHFAWPFAFDKNGLVPVEWFYARITKNDFGWNFSYLEWFTPSYKYLGADKPIRENIPLVYGNRPYGSISLMELLPYLEHFFNAYDYNYIPSGFFLPKKWQYYYSISDPRFSHLPEKVLRKSISLGYNKALKFFAHFSTWVSFRNALLLKQEAISEALPFLNFDFPTFSTYRTKQSSLLDSTRLQFSFFVDPDTDAVKKEFWNRKSWRLYAKFQKPYVLPVKNPVLMHMNHLSELINAWGYYLPRLLNKNLNFAQAAGYDNYFLHTQRPNYRVTLRGALDWFQICTESPFWLYSKYSDRYFNGAYRMTKVGNMEKWSGIRYYPNITLGRVKSLNGWRPADFRVNIDENILESHYFTNTLLTGKYHFVLFQYYDFSPFRNLGFEPHFFGVTWKTHKDGWLRYAIESEFYKSLMNWHLKSSLSIHFIEFLFCLNHFDFNDNLFQPSLIYTSFSYYIRFKVWLFYFLRPDFSFNFLICHAQNLPWAALLSNREILYDRLNFVFVLFLSLIYLVLLVKKYHLFFSRLRLVVREFLFEDSKKVKSQNWDYPFYW